MTMTTQKVIENYHTLNRLFEIINIDDVLVNEENEKLFLQLLKLDEKINKSRVDFIEGIIEEEEHDKIMEDLENEIKKISKVFNLYYHIQFDPRGYHLWISKEMIDRKNYNKHFAVGLVQSLSLFTN